MQLEILTKPFGTRPGVTLPDPDFLKLMGETAIRKLVSDHYDLLIKSDIKHLFPKQEGALEMAKKRSSDFFIQISGGKQYYEENRGKPMMTQRHSKFKITPSGRVVWLNCYKKLLLEIDLPEHIVVSFWNYLNVFSLWMINTPEENDAKDFRINF